MFACRVTAPLRANARPSMVAPVVRLMSVSAMMVPTNRVRVPSVAELATCQKTLHGLPLITSTRLSEAVMRVEDAWKTKTAFGSPPPSRVRVPVRPAPHRSRPPG